MSSGVSKRGFTFAAVTLVLVVVAAFLAWTPLRILYHRNMVLDSRSWYQEPRTLRGRFTPRWLRWRLAGRPDPGQQMQLGRAHEDALVAMGYFERRTYLYAGNDPHGIVDAVRHAPLKDPLYFFSFSPTGTVEILAQRDDFISIDKIVRANGGRR